MTRYPAFYALLVFTGGIFVGLQFNLPDFVSFCLVALLLSLAVILLMLKRMTSALVMAGCMLLALGFFRINLVSQNLPNNHISHFNDLGSESLVYGSLNKEPDVRPDRTYLTVACDSITVAGQAVPVSGSMLVRIDRLDDRFSYADRVAVLGCVRSPIERRNFHGFDYRRFLSLRKIHSYVSVSGRGAVRVLDSGAGNPLISKLVIPLRQYILSVFDKHLDGDERHLVAGYLIGETRFISPQVYEHFRDTGTLHLLAVSGSNVALVIATVTLILKLLGSPRRLIHVMALVTIVIFCQLSFNQPSVVRASVMIGLTIVGWMIYRKANLLNIIAVAALTILAYDPLMVHDVGFQLSFAAAFALIYFLKGLLPRPERPKRLLRLIGVYLLVIVASSIAAQITVAPILAYNFGRIPIITFASNLVVIPISSIAVVSSILLIIFAPIPVLSSVIASISHISLWLSIESVEWFASMPVVKLNLASPGMHHVFLYYVFVFLGFDALKARRRKALFLIVGLVWANVFVWQSVIGKASSKPAITFLDVGSDYCVHIEVPSEFESLITNIKPDSEYDPISRTLAPYLAAERVEMVDLLVSDEDSLISEIVNVGYPDTTEFESVAGGSKATALRLYLNDVGAPEAFVFEADSIRLLWVSGWSAIPAMNENGIRSADVIAVPYPRNSTPEIVLGLVDFEPQIVLVYNYPSRWRNSEVALLENDLESRGIRVVDTQTSGALRLRFNKKDIAMTAAVQE